MTFHAAIRVMLKPDVADVRGNAICESLARHDHPVSRVKAGKYFEVAIEASDAAAASKIANDLAEKVFANPVIETWDVSVEG